LESNSSGSLLGETRQIMSAATLSIQVKSGQVFKIGVFEAEFLGYTHSVTKSPAFDCSFVIACVKSAHLSSI